MINLYWIDRQGIAKEKYQTFTNLKDINRWSKKYLDMNFSIIVNDYSPKPFPEFNKSVNEKMDIRRSFK